MLAPCGNISLVLPIYGQEAFQTWTTVVFQPVRQVMVTLSFGRPLQWPLITYQGSDLGSEKLYFPPGAMLLQLEYYNMWGMSGHVAVYLASPLGESGFQHLASILTGTWVEWILTSSPSSVISCSLSLSLSLWGSLSLVSSGRELIPTSSLHTEPGLWVLSGREWILTSSLHTDQHVG